ncbi:MAG: tetratricopeptide repeat protein, partial [Candidatus Cloacimonetes bacterium]|nr:tetratricopeptide repeat protein [Candidatus Cloacimonadota bacterium]
MAQEMKNVFLSYSHRNRKIADGIDKDLKPLLASVGYRLLRDERDTEYKDKFPEFMKLVHESEYVLMLISDSYLKSYNCMYEVLETYKEQDFEKKILPIILKGTKFTQPEEREIYIDYWSNKHDNLEKKIENLKRLSSVDLIKDLHRYSIIRDTIGKFLQHLTNMKWQTYSEMKKSQYKAIFDYMDILRPDLMQELVRIVQIEDSEDKEIAIGNFLEKDNDNAIAYYIYGSLLWNEKKYKRALIKFEKSIKLKPNFSWAWNGKGNVLYDLGRKDEALIAYETAIKLDPQDATPWNGKGNILRDLGRKEEALTAYKTAIEIDPKLAAPWNGKGNVLSDFGKMEEALT